jgi:hypothetical protein
MEMMMEPLRVTELDMARARRKMKKRIAAAIITAMAETDADYEFIGKRLTMKPAKIEKIIMDFIAGADSDIDQVSDLLLAMGCELTFQLRRYEEPTQPQQAEPERAAA